MTCAQAPFSLSADRLRSADLNRLDLPGAEIDPVGSELSQILADQERAVRERETGNQKSVRRNEFRGMATWSSPTRRGCLGLANTGIRGQVNW